ncbi:DNA-3-methyladenine glycosylase 2 [Ewingella americana]|uniref:DNA-3-methyladenine glycosylase 2 n=1 Tax=Ewingella americana TaxID=41202 RepID=A0A377N983_9GAMM|nr:DNA-3-methyladenine glycosylase 2 [Ewingella americana]
MTKPRYLPYTPPYDWGWMNSFLGARALAGVEQMLDGFYQRTLVVESETGAIAGVVAITAIAGKKLRGAEPLAVA